MRISVKEFGALAVVPPKPILKGIAPLFDSKDAKVRGAAKDLTVELTRWLGHDAVRRDLIEKMRGTMQAEVQAAAEAIEIGRAVRQRLTREERANPPPDTAGVDAMDVDGGDGAVVVATDAAPRPPTRTSLPTGSILDKLEKQPKDKETPKFWDAVNSAKWKERLDAMTRLKELADAPEARIRRLRRRRQGAQENRHQGCQHRVRGRGVRCGEASPRAARNGPGRRNTAARHARQAQG